MFKVWDIFGLFRKFKYDVIEWCIDMLNDVCNEVKVWSNMVFSGTEIPCWDCY